MLKCIKNFKTGLQQRSEQKSEAYLNFMILSVVNLVLLLGGGGVSEETLPLVDLSIRIPGPSRPVLQMTALITRSGPSFKGTSDNCHN